MRLYVSPVSISAITIYIIIIVAFSSSGAGLHPSPKTSDPDRDSKIRRQGYLEEAVPKNALEMIERLAERKAKMTV